MTQAPFQSKRRYPKTTVSSSRPASVGFETNTRYTRKPLSSDRTKFNGPIAKTVSAVKRKAYIAPDASVILMPGTLERADIEEADARKSSYDKFSPSLAKRIKDALHKGSDAYTLYGVDTSEIFTEEIELDENIGVTAVQRCDTEENITVSKKTRKPFKVIKSEFEAKFRVFAGKLYNLRIS